LISAKSPKIKALRYKLVTPEYKLPLAFIVSSPLLCGTPNKCEVSFPEEKFLYSCSASVNAQKCCLNPQGAETSEDPGSVPETSIMKQSGAGSTLHCSICILGTQPCSSTHSLCWAGVPAHPKLRGSPGRQHGSAELHYPERRKTVERSGSWCNIWVFILTLPTTEDS